MQNPYRESRLGQIGKIYLQSEFIYPDLAKIFTWKRLDHQEGEALDAMEL